MGLQRPRVAPPALRSSPGVLTLWPCPEKIPNALGLAACFLPSFLWKKSLPCCGGRGRAGPPFSTVKISPK